VQFEILRIAKQMVKEWQDITGPNCLKGVSGKVIVDEKGIEDSWKEYINCPLSASSSTTICSILPIQFMCLTVFLHYLSPGPL